MRMYAIKSKKTNKVVAVRGRFLFYSYEEARQAARLKVRALIAQAKKKGVAVSFDYGLNDSISRGPTKVTGAFKIVAV